MGRSLRVKPESLDRVKQTLQRNGFPSQKALADEVGISSPTINKFFTGKPIDYKNFTEICHRLGLDWKEIAALNDSPESVTEKKPAVDLSQAPDNKLFYGRARELEEMKRWIVEDKCRVVAMLGMGGSGKTSLARKVADENKAEFDVLIWQNLKNPPSLDKLLADLMSKLSPRESVESESIDDKIRRFIDFLREHRCLIVLNKIESLFQEGMTGGTLQEEYRNYGDLLREIAKLDHNSCLLLTSRELPEVIKPFLGEHRPVRQLTLSQLDLEAARKVLHDTGLKGNPPDAENRLIEAFMYHPGLLQKVSWFIRDAYDKNIDDFLNNGHSLLVNGVRDTLDEHYQRLPEVEKSILLWLTLFHEPVEEKLLIDNILITLRMRSETSSMNYVDVRNSLVSLRGRSLIKNVKGLYSLELLLIEYITRKFIDKIAEELITGKLDFFHRYPILKARTREKVKEHQRQEILKQIAEKFCHEFPTDYRQKLQDILKVIHENFSQKTSYSCGNLINLFYFIEKEKNPKKNPILEQPFDFSNLIINEADLSGLTISNVPFRNSLLKRCRCLQSFGGLLSVEIDRENQWIVIGDASHDVYLFQRDKYRLILEAV